MLREVVIGEHFHEHVVYPGLARLGATEEHAVIVGVAREEAAERAEGSPR